MKDIMSKFLVIIFLLILFSCSISNSQVISSCGIKGGMVFAKHTFDYSINYSFITQYRPGIDIGIYTELFSQPILSGLAEIHYIQKGYKVKVAVTTEQNPEGNGQYITLTPRVDYLSVPVLLKVREEYKWINPYLYVGPHFDIKLAHSDDYGASNFKELHTLDIGATFGAGIQFKLAKKLGILLEGRFNQPITSSVSNSFIKVKNYSFEILTGINFNLLKNKK